MSLDGFLYPLLKRMPHFRSIYLGKEQDTKVHAQTITPFIHCLTCLYHSWNGRCLISDEPAHTATGNRHLSQATLPNNKLSRFTSYNVEFEDEQDHSSNHYESKDYSRYRRICRVQLRKEAPETQQESPWADLAGSNDSTYEQEHDTAESDCSHAQEDHDHTIEDIHNGLVFL